MPELAQIKSAWLALAVLTGGAATVHSASAAPAQAGREIAQSTSEKPQVLHKLFAAANTAAVSSDTAAAMLLAAGPDSTAAVFQWLEDHHNQHNVLPPLIRGRLAPALKGTPKVILRIAQLPQLAAADQQHAFRVGLECIVGLDGPPASAELTALLKVAAKSAGAPTLRAPVSRAVASLSADSDFGTVHAAGWIKAAGPALSTSVVDGIARAKALPMLVGCLMRTTGAEGTLLNRTAALIQQGEPVDSKSAVVAALPFLESNNSFERAESSTILGLVGDRRHVESLIAGLDDAERMVRTNALKALKNLTGMTISGDATRWQAWHTTQEIWWEEEGSALVDALGSASRNELVGILKQVSTKRLYRREIAAQLVPMLHRSKADEVQVAIASLATLRDPSTLGPILDLRQHPDAGVRASVEDALVAFRHSGIKESRVKTRPAQ